MAERRMFTMKVVDSDSFLDMPLSTQALYFHLNMRADDDGFVNNPKKIARMVGASEDDLKLLLSKRFILVFENGVIVIKHWRMHNIIRKDRYNETQYQEEFNQLTLKENGSYTDRGNQLATSWQPPDNQLATDCVPDGNQLATQVRLGKDRLGKDRLGNNSASHFVPPTVDEVRAYCEERGNSIDPERFVDFYASKGWMVGKSKMRDWRAAVRNWERDSRPKDVPIKHPDKSKKAGLQEIMKRMEKNNEDQ